MPYVLQSAGPHSPLPRRKPSKKSLFHIASDDPSPPPSPPPPPPPLTPQAVPFPSSPLPRTLSNSSIVLSNGRPLKSSLKTSSSSLSIPDTESPPGSPQPFHARSHSMPATPSFGPKNVHFKEKDEGLETIRVFRRTGRPLAVSTPNPADDTETETEPEHYPFPLMSPSASAPPPLMEIDPSPDRTSPIPAPHAPHDANLHLESLSLPPSRPPVLRGTILVRNFAFEKHVGVRFTLDNWTTVSEVLATYAGGVSHHEALAGLAPARDMTIGDLLGVLSARPGSAAADPWDRFAFTIRLEDYEPRLADRTLWLVARYTAPGVGEWWDNNGGANYKVAFRPRTAPDPAAAAAAAPKQVGRRRGASAPVSPSTAPFLMSAAQGPAPARPGQQSVNAGGTFSLPRLATFAPPVNRPPTPTLTPPTPRLHLRHYAAPARAVQVVAPPESARASPAPGTVLIGGHPAADVGEEVRSPRTEHGSVWWAISGGLGLHGAHASQSAQDGAKPPDVVEDEGFGSADSEDGGAPAADEQQAHTDAHADVPEPEPAPPHELPPSPTIFDRDQPPPISSAAFAQLTSRLPALATPPPQLDFDAAGVRPSDSSYAALLREWCFAQGPSASRTGPPGADAGMGMGMGMSAGLGMEVGGI